MADGQRKDIKIFLDDVREPPDSTWIVARSADEAVKAIEAIDDAESFEAIMLDHDLGHCSDCEKHLCVCGCDCRCHLTGYFVVCWVEAEGRWPQRRPECHSQNPVGRSRMEVVITRNWESESRDV